jgi:tetratricopeptide (TPR) repeat protein
MKFIHMKALASAAGLLLLASSAMGQNWFTGSFEEALDKAREDGKRVLIQFHAFGCQGCDLLSRQFFAAEAYRDFLDVHFVLFRAERGVGDGDVLFNRFDVRTTPTVILLAPDGDVVDWHVGYGFSPEEYLEKLKESIQGLDTYQDLQARYARDPKDVAVVFNLARKYSERLMEDKAIPLFRQVLALDPEARAGTTVYLGRETRFVEAASYALGRLALSGRPQDPEPMKAFIREYPQSALLKNACESLGYYYRTLGTKEEASVFFEEFVARYPEDPYALNAYVARIIRDKGDLDRGIELAREIRTLTASNPIPSFTQNLVQLYILKGEKDQAARFYGRAFMEGRVTSLAYDLAGFANFWCDRNDNLDAALAMAETALRLEPDNIYFLQTAAKIHLKMGNEQKAVEVFGAAFVQGNLDQPHSLHYYAQFWSKLGKNLDSALEAAQKAAELQPGAPHIWDLLARLYLAADRSEDALEAAQKAAAAAAGQPDLADHYAKRLVIIKEDIARKRR